MNKWAELKAKRDAREEAAAPSEPERDDAYWREQKTDWHHKRGGVNAKRRGSSGASGNGSGHFFGGRGQSANTSAPRRNTIVERALRAAAIERQGGRCFYCERLMVDDLKRPGLQATLEHLKEWSEGGANTPENTVAACHDCNAERPRTGELRREFAHYGGELAEHMTGLAVSLGEERWRAAIAERAAEAAMEVYEAEGADYDDGAEDRVQFLQGRGEIIENDNSMGGVLRLRTSLAHLRDRRLLTPGEHVALETYARLFSQAHDILQPFLPPHEMMEWRMERMFELNAIRRYALRYGRKMTAVCDAVCGRGEWLIGRGRMDWDRAKYLKLAAIRIARWLSESSAEKAA